MTLTYNAIDYAESYGIDNRKGMKGFYRSMKEVRIPSCFKVAIISRACQVVKGREEETKRERRTVHTKPLRRIVCITSGFFITATGKLFISLGPDRFEVVQLNQYVHEKVINDVKIRSLTIHPTSISITYSRQVEAMEVRKVFGVNRNERNLTYGDKEKVYRLDISEVVRVNKLTREVVASFHRDDARIRGKISSKYWRRAKHRTEQVLHDVTNSIVKEAASEQAALAGEDLTNIRKKYRKGNGRGRDYRFRLNSWPFSKAWHMLEYKAAWSGVTIIQLSIAETRGSSSTMCAGRGFAVPEGMTWGTRGCSGARDARCGWTGTKMRQLCCP